MYPRFAEQRLRQNLADTRVVLLTGPRQSGKTTLARRFAGAGMDFYSLDDATTLSAANADPVGFVRAIDKAVIDEIQRAPALLLAIKRAVDEDQRSGRFLLTGSANLLTLPTVADSLAGRMGLVDLLPLSVAEVTNRHPTFLGNAFRGRPTPVPTAIVADELTRTVLSGGYPEALRRPTWRRRRDWCLDYVRAIVERDVRDVAQIEHLHQMPKLIRVLAHHSGQLVNYSQIGAPLGLNHVTTQKYTGILEQLYLIRTLPPWSGNELKRLIKTPKLHFLDSGVLAALRDLSPERVREDRMLFGAVLESFVLSELLKQASWSESRFEFSHYRDKDQNEVDIVVEDEDRNVVGMEVKASATVSASDFNGLRRLADLAGPRFKAGMLLHDDHRVIPFGANLFAVPISSIWS